LSQSFLIYRILLPQLIISLWKDKKILALKKLRPSSENKNHVGMKANQNWRLLMRRKKVLILHLKQNKSLNLKIIFLEMIFQCKNKTRYWIDQHQLIYNNNQIFNHRQIRGRGMFQLKEPKQIHSLRSKNSQKRVKKRKLNIKNPTIKAIRYFNKVNSRIFLSRSVSLIDK